MWLPISDLVDLLPVFLNKVLIYLDTGSPDSNLILVKVQLAIFIEEMVYHWIDRGTFSKVDSIFFLLLCNLLEE